MCALITRCRKVTLELADKSISSPFLIRSNIYEIKNTILFAGHYHTVCTRRDYSSGTLDA